MTLTDNNYEIDYDSVFKAIGGKWNSSSYVDDYDYTSPFVDNGKMKVIMDLLERQRMKKAMASNNEVAAERTFEQLTSHELHHKHQELKEALSKLNEELTKVATRLRVVAAEENRVRFDERHGGKIYRFRKLLHTAHRLEGLVKFGPVTSIERGDQPVIFEVHVSQLVVKSDKDGHVVSLETAPIVVSTDADHFDAHVNAAVFSYCDSKPLDAKHWDRWERRLGYLLEDHSTILDDVLNRPLNEPDDGRPSRKLTL